MKLCEVTADSIRPISSEMFTRKILMMLTKVAPARLELSKDGTHYWSEGGKPDDDFPPLIEYFPNGQIIQTTYSLELTKKVRGVLEEHHVTFVMLRTDKDLSAWRFKLYID